MFDFNSYSVVFCYVLGLSLFFPIKLSWFNVGGRWILVGLLSLLFLLSGFSLEVSIWWAFLGGAYYSLIIFSYYWQIYFAFLLIESGRGGGYLEQFGVRSENNQVFFTGVKLAIFCYLFARLDGKDFLLSSIDSNCSAVNFYQDLQLLLEQSFQFVMPIMTSFLMIELAISASSILLKNHNFWLESYLGKILVLFIWAKQSY